LSYPHKTRTSRPWTSSASTRGHILLNQYVTRFDTRCGLLNTFTPLRQVHTG
jgi:hypothetical protein